MASELLLVANDLVKCYFVLDQERNLDVKLVDVLFSHLVLSNVLSDSLPESLEFCSVSAST